MSAKILDGKKAAAIIKANIARAIAARRANQLPIPTLAVILVGENPASESYVKHKQRACEDVGIPFCCHRLSDNTTQECLKQIIWDLNQDDNVHGILLQLPLPTHLNANELLMHINPYKDVDGFHPLNMGRLALRIPTLRPCTPFGVMKLLAETNEDLVGKHAVVVGASNIVGRPMALELLLGKCTVTICHRFTTHLATHVQNADILISAIGKPGVIQSDWIKPDAIVVDVGFTRIETGQIVGDIEFVTACQRAAWITPVPGGVGQMTVATLLENTLTAIELAEKKEFE
jgi:methylenetetrahydrofolate dehydrogenase (NADP+)/methenyltetrahydrofolate cyclohydrolase